MKFQRKGDEGMKVSVVVSCYNEEKGIRVFYEATTGVLDSCSWDYDLIFVNDGSVDDSLKCFRALADENSNVRVISLSRNFGHEAAMIAGIDHASGDGIVCMDAEMSR